MDDEAIARLHLTAAESAVLAQLVEGRTPAEIAEMQDVAIATIRTHITRLHDKFGVTRTLDVVRLAMKRSQP